jgi:hypothetical protein
MILILMMMMIFILMMMMMMFVTLQHVVGCPPLPRVLLEPRSTRFVFVHAHPAVILDQACYLAVVAASWCWECLAFWGFDTLQPVVLHP